MMEAGNGDASVGGPKTWSQKWSQNPVGWSQKLPKIPRDFRVSCWKTAKAGASPRIMSPLL